MDSSGIEVCSGSHVRRTVRSDLSRMVCLQEARFFIRDLHCSLIGSGGGCGGESWLRFTIVIGGRTNATAGEWKGTLKKGLGFSFCFFLSSCFTF